MTPGHAAPWSSFEDYLDFPSPLPTPRLAPLHASSLAQPASNTSNALLNTPTYSLQTTTNAAAASTATPPPAPGSSPEVLFVSSKQYRYRSLSNLNVVVVYSDTIWLQSFVALEAQLMIRSLTSMSLSIMTASQRLLIVSRIKLQMPIARY